MDDEKRGFFHGVSPKFTFVFGLMIGVAVISTVAFFVVLTSSIGGSEVEAIAGSVNSANTNSAAAAVDQEPTTVSVADIGLSDAHFRGNEDAPVTIVEYSDIECPYCARFHETMTQVMDNYAGKVKWVWKHYPLSFHPEAEPAANAAECAGEQGKFWEYLDALYENQASLGSDLYPQLASDFGLNASTFNTCLVANKYGDLFVADFSEGSDLGIAGTPGSIVFKTGAKTGEVVAGAYPYDYVSQIIDELLK